MYCDNGRCVPLSSICDGVNDCGDGSDELNCDISPTTTTTRTGLGRLSVSVVHVSLTITTKPLTRLCLIIMVYHKFGVCISIVFLRFYTFLSRHHTVNDTNNSIQHIVRLVGNLRNCLECIVGICPTHSVGGSVFFVD